MAARIRFLGGNVVRLDPRVFEAVRHVARLAGVTPSEVVEHVLMEVLQVSAVRAAFPPSRVARPAAARTRRPLPPAQVIPIARARTRAADREPGAQRPEPA